MEREHPVIEHSVVGRSAAFSVDGVYRYGLTRTWSSSGTDAAARQSNPLLFVGLNPSTADGDSDDPTIRRVIRFAMAWGHDSIFVCNLFAYRSTQPAALKAAADPVGALANDAALADAARRAGRVLCGWGNGLLPGSKAVARMMRARVQEVLEILSEGAGAERICCLHVTLQQQPQHPLYVRADARPKPFPPQTAREAEAVLRA
ncbi:hypothetical protein EMIHUDRAFT_64003 [Emiliania huxleyi CCMP1516]|uniref:DUF1643 domain-containing protein n=2 Tax=Emiliania huxleyi TaxID=2903 RepID=A0A0D3K0P6_EMIH1|nr:hypothetical protein EMIHUDRAFT_64003 [Emiliania huxleyi CCMP1516]EOD29331.1 hypothetical protein EMIHUDRAFT_64003 [Emiliania huxleyi CCMP1516]|eukprot:XP_005781760.1 hypothetical protein EMIHUDRAFT_64003 [Emiliania huxleyi CCMP1516]